MYGGGEFSRSTWCSACSPYAGHGKCPHRHPDGVDMQGTASRRWSSLSLEHTLAGCVSSGAADDRNPTFGHWHSARLGCDPSVLPCAAGSRGRIVFHPDCAHNLARASLRSCAGAQPGRSHRPAPPAHVDLDGVLRARMDNHAVLAGPTPIAIDETVILMTPPVYPY